MVSLVLDKSRGRSLCMLMLLVHTSAIAAAAEFESLDISGAQHITATPSRPELFLSTAKGQLIQWTAAGQTVLVNDLQADPAQLSDLRFLFCREQSVSAIGKRIDQSAFAGYRLRTQQQLLVAEWQPGLSVPLKFLRDGSIACVAATAANIYLVSNREPEYAIWRIKAGVATLGEPVKLYTTEQPVIATALNYQGHLLTAVRVADQRQVGIRFHHAETGKPLLLLPTGLDDVRSLAVGPDELLYAAGTLDNIVGLYRLDVAYGDGGQKIDARLIKQLDGLKEIASSTASLYMLNEDQVLRMQFKEE